MPIHVLTIAMLRGLYCRSSVIKQLRAVVVCAKTLNYALSTTETRSRVPIHVMTVESYTVIYAFNSYTYYYYPRESEGLCFYRRWFVCLSVCLSVCLFVCYHDNEIKRGRIWTKFFGKVPRGKGSPSSFSVTIASRVWRLLSKNAVNRGFFFPM